MDLAPAWAKPVAILGLEMQIFQLRMIASTLRDSSTPAEFVKAEIELFQGRLDRLKELR